MSNNFEQEEIPSYTTVIYEVRAALDVSFIEYILLDMVDKLSRRTGYCYKSSQKMADDLGISKRGINKMITRLIEQNLLERVSNNHTLRVTNIYLDTLLVPGNKVPAKRNKSGNKVPESGNKVPVVGTQRPNNRELDIQLRETVDKPITVNKKVGIKTKNVGDAYYLCEQYSDLIGDKFVPWYIKCFVEIGRERVMILASQAKADGENPQRLFSYLLKKEIGTLA